MSASKLKQILCVQQKKLSSYQQQQQKPIDENRLLLSKVQKWDSATTLKFLKLYYKYPCLWDMNHKHYKDRYIRQMALEKMSDYMNLPNFDSRYVALKIRVLRTTYMEERRKIQRRSIETGHLTTQLDWFKFADSFLKNNIVRFRKGKIDVKNSSISSSSATRNVTDSNLNNSVNNNNDKIVPDNNNYAQISVKTEFSECTENNLNEPETITTTSPDILYYQNNCEQQNEFNNSGDCDEPQLNYSNHNNNDDDYNANNSVENRRLSFNDIFNSGIGSTSKKLKLDDNNNSNDEFDSFGKSVSAQLKSLPLDRAYELELKIQYLLTNAKLEAFGKNASTVLNMNFF